MAASTITRDTWTNDSGTTSVPVGDGTILNNSVLQNHIYARIDAMFAGTGSYTTFELGGVLKADGFGTHTFSAGGTGSNDILLRNTTAGTGNSARLIIGNDNDAQHTILKAYSSTFSSFGFEVANGTLLYANGAGGLSIVANTGDLRLYADGNEYMRLFISGGVSIGNTTDPGAAVLSVGASSDATMGASGYKMAAWPTTATAANANVANGAAVKLVTSLRANKHDITTLTDADALSAVMAMRPVLYRSCVDDDQRLWPGLLAEDIATAAPLLAVYRPDGVLQSVAYDRVPVYLVAAVQALAARVCALEAA